LYNGIEYIEEDEVAMVRRGSLQAVGATKEFAGPLHGESMGGLRIFPNQYTTPGEPDAF